MVRPFVPEGTVKPKIHLNARDEHLYLTVGFLLVPSHE